MNKYLVIDVETTGGFGCPLVYDIGYRVTDNKQRIYCENSIIVKDIFTDFAKMKTAYYKEKVPMYIQAWRDGEFIPMTFADARAEINQVIEYFGVQFVCAYNAKFDINALNCTCNFLLDKPEFFMTDITVYDIWGMACETLALQKNFFKKAFENRWESDCGNVKTSAEILWRYLSGDADFEESHTGFKDVEIECAIMHKCFAQHKKMTKTIFAMPWKIPQPDYHAFKMTVR